MRRFLTVPLAAWLCVVGTLAACLPALPPTPTQPMPSSRPVASPTMTATPSPAPLPTAAPAEMLWPRVGPDLLALVGRYQLLTQTADPLYTTLHNQGRGPNPTTPTGYTASTEGGRTVWSQQKTVELPGGLSGKADIRFVPQALGDDFRYAASFSGLNSRQLTTRWQASFYIDSTTCDWLINEVLANGRTRRLEMTGGDYAVSRNDNAEGTITVSDLALVVSETGAYGQPSRTLTITHPSGLKATATFIRGELITGLDVTEGGQNLGRVLIPPAADW